MILKKLFWPNPQTACCYTPINLFGLTVSFGRFNIMLANGPDNSLWIEVTYKKWRWIKEHHFKNNKS